MDERIATWLSYGRAKDNSRLEEDAASREKCCQWRRKSAIVLSCHASHWVSNRIYWVIAMQVVVVIMLQVYILEFTLLMIHIHRGPFCRGRWPHAEPNKPDHYVR